MKGKIADSIIIKVGHGIMEIPRKKIHSRENKISPEKVKFKKQKKKFIQES